MFKDIRILLWFCVIHVLYIKASPSCQKYLCTPEVERLRNYINIRTTKDRDLRPAVDYLKRLGAAQGVEVTVVEAEPNKPIVILKWPGKDPTLSSIVLLSYIDVNFACYEDGWKYPPFSGEINDNCEIVGRGTQGQKCLSLLHYEALSRLKQNNETLLRTVYMILTSDQITPRNNVRMFFKTKTFQDMNVGFALGEGGPSPKREVYLYNEFKTKYDNVLHLWQISSRSVQLFRRYLQTSIHLNIGIHNIIIRVDCYGQSTSSAFLSNINSTALGVCQNVYNSYNQYREEQYRLSLRSKDFGDYTVINFVGGQNLVEYNAVPAHVVVYYSAYLAFDTSVDDFIELVRGWVSAAGGNITLSSVVKEKGIYYTKTDNSNPYYVALKEAFNELDISFRVRAAVMSDTTYLVNNGIPAFGLFPVLNTPLLVNAVNERLSLYSYLEGIRILEVVISRLANIADNKVGDDPRKYLILSKSNQ